MTLRFIFEILAVISLFVAAVGLPLPRINLVALGLLLWLLSQMVTR